MEGTLLVAPEDLLKAAGEFQAADASVKGITAEMMNIINALKPSYTGDAANAFYTKFDGLQEDMNQIDAKINEHVNDLNEMANNYSTVEARLTEQNAALKNDYI